MSTPDGPCTFPPGAIVSLPNVPTTINDLSAALAGRYRLEREVGAGGMATVFLAHDPRHDRRVALKVLRPELASMIGAERFLAEIRTTANLQHPHILFAKSAQVLGLGLCGLLLLFTLMLMRDLGATMKSHERSHDGNLLISEAQEDQLDGIHRWATATGSTVRTLRPFVSAQLVAVNGTPLAEYVKKPSDTFATLTDPIRLSWTDTLPANNRVAGGNWWPAGTADWQQISAEPEVMTDMGFRYGDTLTYQIGGRPYDFTLVASHAFQASGGSITFWFQVPLSARTHIVAPTLYLGSMELPESAWTALADLWQQHPTLSLVPLRELTERFDQTLGIVTKVTRGYAAMVLLLALFVLAASVRGFSADDRQKNGLLMSMGLRRRDCLTLNFYDWGVTALIAAAGAIVGTWVAGLLIYRAQFNLPYHPDTVWVAGIVVSMMAAVCAVGYLACRQSLEVSVRDLLAT